jgi:uncharacterized protein YlxW (UPF0749 family)
MRLRFSTRVLAAVVAGIVGFVLVSQLRGEQRFTRRLQAESESDLARILSSLNSEADSLRDEIASLRLQLQSLQTSSQREDAAARAAQEQEADLAVLAGTVQVHGPGIVVTIDDPARSLRYDSLIDLVQELRDAGAEALSVNDQRVGATSSFFPQGDAIALDGSRIEAPYRVTAIGEAATLASGLAIRGGAVESLSAFKGVKVQVDRHPDVIVTALVRPPSFKAARPVSS